MSIAVLIITVGPVVSLVFFVVVIHSGNVFLICLEPDLFDCERYIPLKDCWIDWGERCTLWFLLWFGGCCNFLELGVLRVVSKLFPVINHLIRARVVMPGGFATASAQIIFTICVREVTG